MKRARSPSPQSIKDKFLSIPLISDWKLLHNSVLALLPSFDLIQHSLVNYTDKNACIKFAAFDMDDTLIMPKNGAVFPRDDPSDWKWLLPVVPNYLKILYNAGFMIIIISNQSGIGGKGWNSKKADAIKQKIINISKSLQIPLVAFISTKEDIWRKPNIGMWKLLQEHIISLIKEEDAKNKIIMMMNEGITPSGCSFYVGDAAGRKIVTIAGRKKDFSCSDRKFAYNSKIPFLTPEQFFFTPSTELLDDSSNNKNFGKILSKRLLDIAANSFNPSSSNEVNWGGIGPKDLKNLPSSYNKIKINCINSDGKRDILNLSSEIIFHKNSQELIIFVGYPGCGKTTFFNRFLKSAGYIHINRDTLKTKEKCISEAEKYWKSGKSIVIDNTNPSHSDCMTYIKLVKGLINPVSTPLPVRIFVFQATKELSMHMSNVRAKLGIAPRISSIAYNMFKSKFEPWTVEDVKSADIEELLEIPPVISFDGLHEGTEKEFFLLS